jgi:hypothetical protein
VNVPGVRTAHGGGSRGRCLAAAAGILAAAAALLSLRSVAAEPVPIEHLRGIYLQQAIELATVGTRTVLITRMTRFWRCGTGRGRADDFNGHLVDVAGREVPGLGFVAGIVDAIEGCTHNPER